MLLIRFFHKLITSSYNTLNIRELEIWRGRLIRIVKINNPSFMAGINENF